MKKVIVTITGYHKTGKSLIANKFVEHGFYLIEPKYEYASEQLTTEKLHYYNEYIASWIKISQSTNSNFFVIKNISIKTIEKLKKTLSNATFITVKTEIFPPSEIQYRTHDEIEFFCYDYILTKNYLFDLKLIFEQIENKIFYFLSNQ